MDEDFKVADLLSEVKTDEEQDFYLLVEAHNGLLYTVKELSWEHSQHRVVIVLGEEAEQ